MRSRPSILLSLCVALLVPAAAAAQVIEGVDNSFDEVGSFVGYLWFYDVNPSGYGPTSAIPEDIFPDPPPGFVPPSFDMSGVCIDAGDVAFVADVADMTLMSSADLHFTAAQPHGAGLVELRNGDYGLIQDLQIQWDGSGNKDFTNVIFVVDILALYPGIEPSARFQLQLAPSADPENDFEQVRILYGNPGIPPGPFEGVPMTVGYVTENGGQVPGPADGYPDRPLRAFSLANVGTLAPGGTAFIAFVLDSGVPVENTAEGDYVEALPLDRTTLTSPVTVTYEHVDEQGQTTLTTSTQGPPPPRGFKVGMPGTYYDISTTATVSGTIEICVDYSGIHFGGMPKLLHTSDGGATWDDITTFVDDLNQVVCGTTTSFSTFVIVEPMKPEERTLALAETIGGIPLAQFDAPDPNAQQGRRTALTNLATNAAAAIANGSPSAAIALLQALLQRVDGITPPPDWMLPSTDQELVRDEAQILIQLLQP